MCMVRIPSDTRSLVTLVFLVREGQRTVVAFDPPLVLALGPRGIVLRRRFPRDAQGGSVAELPDRPSAPMGDVAAVTEAQVALHALLQQRAHARPASTAEVEDLRSGHPQRFE